MIRAPGPQRTRRDCAARVIAVGTTVVRALETARADGTIEPADGWTRVVVALERGVRGVDGLITGWRDPDAWHLLVLRALAGRELVERSCREAHAAGYRRRGLADSHLPLF